MIEDFDPSNQKLPIVIDVVTWSVKHNSTYLCYSMKKNEDFDPSDQKISTLIDDATWSSSKFKYTFDIQSVITEIKRYDAATLKWKY